MVSERHRYPWRTFIFLVAAGTLTGPLVIPYFLGLEAIAPGPQPPESLRSLILSGLYQNLMFLVPAAAIGLLVAPKLGLGAPYLESWLDGAPRPAQPLSSIVRPALFWATVTALIASALTGFSATRSKSLRPRPRSMLASPSHGGAVGWRAFGRHGRKRSSIACSCFHFSPGWG